MDDIMGRKESVTQKNILEVAAEEFMAKGFQKASLREIVRKAGVTTGAFYGYYDSKEAIFDALVKEHAENLIGIYKKSLSDFENLPAEKQTNSIGLYSSESIVAMYKYAYENIQAFRLIIKCSAGTKYEHFIHDFAVSEIESTHNFYKVLEKQGMQPLEMSPFTEKVVINGMFASFFELLMKDISQEEGVKCVKELYSFFEAGWRRFLHYSE